MSQDTSALERRKAQKVHKLYDNLHEVLGDKFVYERFVNWQNQYLRESREFHGLNHMLAMSELNENLTEQQGHKSAGVYSMVAGFFHDEDYPSISEDMKPISKRFIDKYIENKDGKKVIKRIAQDDRIGQILLGVFGFYEGQTLSPFPTFGENPNPGGMNEFYCAVAAASELKELGKDEHFITAIVAGIEATIPFRAPTRMTALRTRVEKTSSNLDIGLTAHEIDEIMVGATHLANLDVLSFLGGLNPEEPNVKPTTASVLYTIKGGDMLSPEEIPQLRTKGMPPEIGSGNYTPREFLNARVKRAGLYHLVLPGNDTERSIPNLFFETKLSGGNTYPPNDWADKANKLAYEVNASVRVAEYSRLISAGIVNALTTLSGGGGRKVKDLLGGMQNIMQPCNLPDDASQVRKLAFACLNGREPASDHDIRRSPIAEYILSKLDENQVTEFGKAARASLFLTPAQQRDETITKEKAQEFLVLATKYLGQDVEKIRDDVARSVDAGGNMKAVAVRMRTLKLPEAGLSAA